MSTQRAPIEVLLRAEHSGGEVSVIESGSLLRASADRRSTTTTCTPAGFERYFGRMAAERRGTDPPEWALQPIPESSVVGPSIGERQDGGR